LKRDERIVRAALQKNFLSEVNDIVITPPAPITGHSSIGSVS